VTVIKGAAIFTLRFGRGWILRGPKKPGNPPAKKRVSIALKTYLTR
jgi:hypothetical protein